MNKLLTIAIPTFNRSELLDRQLAWLAGAIKGFESECEILISDNCSTDDTSKVVEKWQLAFENTQFISKRNQENIGAVKNIASCIQSATGKYVWTISDDDKIFDQTVAYLVKVLKNSADLALMILNFSKSDAKTGKVFEPRCFEVEKDEITSNGIALFEQRLEESIGGVGLTTALVYKTQLAQHAIGEWETGLENLAVQIYWTAFCASQGTVRLTKENYLECVAGTHYFMENPKLLVTLEYADIPEVLAKLPEVGFSRSFSRKMVLSRLINFNWRVLFGALRRWPLIAIKAMVTYLFCVYQCTVGNIFHPPSNPRQLNLENN
ncbi:MAG: glycosyltransferase family 2 protein [Cyanobacteria bacterium J06639_18]